MTAQKPSRRHEMLKTETGWTCQNILCTFRASRDLSIGQAWTAHDQRLEALGGKAYRAIPTKENYWRAEEAERTAQQEVVAEQRRQRRAAHEANAARNREARLGKSVATIVTEGGEETWDVDLTLLEVTPEDRVEPTPVPVYSITLGLTRKQLEILLDWGVFVEDESKELDPDERALFEQLETLL